METSTARRATADATAAAAAFFAGGIWLSTFSSGSAAVGFLAIAAGAAITAIGVVSVLRRHPRETTTADRITLIRAVLAGCCATLTVPVVAGVHLPGWLLVTLGSIAYLLDGVDGRVARRTGHVSREGARMDMEVDASLLLVLSCAAAPVLGWWALGIGLMRYAFVAASRFRPAMRGELRPSQPRRVIGAAQALALLVAVAPPVPLVVGSPVVAAALLLLAVSFALDIVDLERRHRA